MRLVIVHNHFRLGGVRRVIETAAPHLVRALQPDVSEVVLVGGERPKKTWRNRFVAILGPTPVQFATDQSLRYLSEQRSQPAVVARRVKRFLERLLARSDQRSCIVWAHNPGLGRNLILTRGLVQACATRKVTLLLHHHDWWFDNRWQRWPEMRRAGFGKLFHVAKTILAPNPNVRHFAINRADAALLRRHFPRQSVWLPNLSEPTAPPPTSRVRAARAWLRRELRETAPVWLMPCRLLRRKNIAEALLLTRWLRPEAWLVTTGDASSADEIAYARSIARAARRHRWRLRLGILGGDESAKPTVPELVAASEVVLLTSLQEGFGLPYLETAASRRPLIARSVPNVAPDLAQFGFRFPQMYQELLIHPDLFDWPAEQRRQTRIFQAWRAKLPKAVRAQTRRPVLLAGKQPRFAPFSRLTLTAQLEVLIQPLAVSWSLCAPLNPWLGRWRAMAARRALGVSAWPRSAKRWLSGGAYAKGWLRMARARVNVPASASASRAAQREFIARTLAAENLYPLTWNQVT